MRVGVVSLRPSLLPQGDLAFSVGLFFFFKALKEQTRTDS